MSKNKTIDTEGISKIKAATNELENFITSLNGKKIDLSKEKNFSQGPYLHQDSENITEKESAAYERENKQVFDFIQSIKTQIYDIFRKYK